MTKIFGPLWDWIGRGGVADLKSAGRYIGTKYGKGSMREVTHYHPKADPNLFVWQFPRGT